MMEKFKENDLAKLKIAVHGKSLQEPYDDILIPKESVGVILSVFDYPNLPLAYLLEFYLNDGYVSATVEAKYIIGTCYKSTKNDKANRRNSKK